MGRNLGKKEGRGRKDIQGRKDGMSTGTSKIAYGTEWARRAGTEDLKLSLE